MRQYCDHYSPVPRLFNAVRGPLLVLRLALPQLLRHRHIALGDPLQKLCVRSVQHDVKVLQSPHTFERRPIPEPDQTLPSDAVLSTERLLHKILDL